MWQWNEEAVLELVLEYAEAQPGQREKGEVLAALLPCVRFPALGLIMLVRCVEANALLMAQPVTRVRPLTRPPCVVRAAWLHNVKWTMARHTLHHGTQLLLHMSLNVAERVGWLFHCAWGHPEG